ncbi:CHAT domain-containing protein [Scytonema sp. PRP1]|uniref:CHAT domain-containing protein n=1 Tax=Scytonema sp. PRP1 TaxID=3120513 RepID=UPI002FD69147
MIKNRREAYLHLIQALQSCTSGEEIKKIYDSYPDLFDADLFQMMEEKAVVIAEQGQHNAANGWRDFVARLSFVLGIDCYYHSDYRKAIDYLNRALDMARKIENHSFETEVLAHLGLVYQSQGEYGKAIYCLEQSSQIAQDIEDRETEAQALGNLGITYGDLGEYDRAIQYSLQALKIYQTIRDRQQEGNSWGNLGVICLFQGNYEQAIEYHQKHLEIAQDIKDSQGEALALTGLGIAYHRKGDYDKAIDNHKKALDINRKINNLVGEAKDLGNLGIAYYSLRDFDKAINYQNQVLTLAKKIGDRQMEGVALSNKGHILQLSGHLTEAEDILMEAIQVKESIRAGLGSNDSNKVSIFETQTHTYNILQAVLVANNKTDSALEIAERSRARAFVELLARRLSPKQTEQFAITPPTIEQIKQIAKTQNATIVQYSIKQDVVQVENKLPGISCESELYIWVIKPTGDIIFRQANLKPLWLQQNSSLEKLVTLARTTSIGLAREAYWVNIVNNTPADNRYLQQLYEILIQPIEDILPSNPKDHIIFIPQGPLFLVPFPALQDSTGKYLISRHTILTAPSIEVLGLTQKQREKVKEAALREVVVVGNPSMPSLPPQFAGTSFQLQPLFGAQKEAQAIASMFDTQAIISSVATEAFIVEQMPKARIIHLATHGLLDDVRGLGSAIALASCGEDDGWLTAEEILKLELHAELVILSACDTGRGRITGDGVVGLSRSFISAGVSSILVSLWSVPDDSTVLLMTEFYRNFQEHKQDKAAALRSAMLSTMKQYPNNPRAWAAFTLIGEAE